MEDDILYGSFKFARRIELCKQYLSFNGLRAYCIETSYVGKFKKFAFGRMKKMGSGMSPHPAYFFVFKDFLVIINSSAFQVYLIGRSYVFPKDIITDTVAVCSVKFVRYLNIKF
jgi:hypothetical protein